MESISESIAEARGYLELVLKKTTPAVVFTVIAVFFIALFFRYYNKAIQPPTGSYGWIERRITKTKPVFIISRHRFEKKDIIPLLIITAAFSFLAFFQLGDMTAPQSFHRFSHGNNTDTVVIELLEPQEISSIMYYAGLRTGHYELEFSEDGKNWLMQIDGENSQTPDTLPTPAIDQKSSYLFKWRYADLNDGNPPVRFIRLTAVPDVPGASMELGELALYDYGGALVPYPLILSPDAPELFDEQELAPENPTYMNSMYFDEVYHARAGFEFLQNEYPNEKTHPPLGKEIISASILAFGMTPFGWRFSGALFGVLMLILLYVFIKNMFGKTPVAVCGTLLFGFDIMRFVQTRIATIDTFAVFFILLSYYFMYRYITKGAKAPFRKSLVPLALSGAAFGLGCASKWVAIYSGLGLAAILAIRLASLARHYREEGSGGFSAYLTKTLIFSALFFIVIPAVIYCLSYIPYGLARDMTVGGGMLWDRRFYEIIWDNQIHMISYHGTLITEHPYSSPWWQWILDARPILYVNNYKDGLRSSFGAFGNPIVWWGGFVAMVFMAIHAVKNHDGKALFILTGYLSQLLPWLAIKRIVFVYHYFPSTLFLVLALSYVFNSVYNNDGGKYKMAVYSYTAMTGTVFAMFYPALSGFYVPEWYFSDFLRWIPALWPF